MDIHVHTTAAISRFREFKHRSCFHQRNFQVCPNSRTEPRGDPIVLWCLTDERRARPRRITPSHEECTVMTKSILLLMGSLAFTGVAGCSANAPSTPPASSASQQSADSEGSATNANEAAPDEGSGN